MRTLDDLLDAFKGGSSKWNSDETTTALIASFLPNGADMSIRADFKANIRPGKMNEQNEIWMTFIAFQIMNIKFIDDETLWLRISNKAEKYL